MEEVYKLIIAVSFLFLGFLIGNLLAKVTKEELHSGKKYFKILILVSLVGAVVFLILGNDALLFGLLFIAIVTSRSLNK
jgi:hypothetical protein